jgi:hypothetical protein
MLNNTRSEVGWAIWSWEIGRTLTEAEILMTEAKSIEELEVGAGFP